MRSQLARVWGDAADETKARVLRSVSCLFVQLQPLWPSPSQGKSADAEREPLQRHRLEKMAHHAQLRQGAEWT